MPLIILAGRPCVGKTAFANALQQYFASQVSDSPSSSESGTSAQAGARSVVVINDESLGIKKGSGYATAAAEKVGRASLKSAAERALASSSIVIVDGLNYIKGYRYELYCLARTVGTASICVWVQPDVSLEAATAANAERAAAAGNDAAAQERAYTPATLQDLWLRFEPPDERNRWEAPLVLVRAGATAVAALAVVHTATTLAPSMQPVFTSKFDLGIVRTSDQLAVARTRVLDAARSQGVVGVTAAHTAAATGTNGAAANHGSGDGGADAEGFDIGNLKDFDGLGLDERHGGDDTVATAAAEATTFTSAADTAPSSAAATATAPSALPAAKTSAFKRAAGGGKPSAFSRATTTASTATATASSFTATAAEVAAAPAAPAVVDATLPIATAPTSAAWDWSVGCMDVAAVLASGRSLKPTTATQVTPSYAPNFLFQLDAATSDVVAKISVAMATDAGAGVVHFPGCAIPLRLPAHRRVTPAELKRLKRTFEKFATDVTPGKDTSGMLLAAEATAAATAAVAAAEADPTTSALSASAAAAASTATMITQRFVEYLNGALQEG